MFQSLVNFGKYAGLVLLALGSFVLSFIILNAGLGIAEPIAAFMTFGMFLIVLWLVTAYVRYRIGRQEELLQVLRSAVESNVALEPAVQAYLSDRPSTSSGPIALTVVAVLMTPLFPGALLIVLWFYWNGFDSRAKAFRQQLYDGQSVADALDAAPGTLSDEARLMIGVGCETNRLGLALKHAERERLASGWLDLIPRVAYPLMVFFIILSVQLFGITLIMPKFKKIFDEFNGKLPEVTRQFINFATIVEDYAWLITLVKLGLICTAIAACASPVVRWHLPIVRRFYRADVQGRILRSLGLLVEAEAPMHDALDFLADSPELPWPARHRLAKAADSSSAGQPLAAVLTQNGLLPKAMGPLLTAAESTHTLTWALHELGEHLSQRALRIVRRATLILSPIVIVLLGALVAFTCLALFHPLITLISSLAE